MTNDLESLYNATDNLINQQFYRNGSDTIIGRTPDVSVKIRQSGQIIQKFKTLFNQNMKFFLEGEYFQFLRPVQIIKGITEEEIAQINEELTIKIASLRDAFEANDSSKVVLYTIVLSSVISKIREFHFKTAIDEVISRAKAKININEAKIQAELDKLFMRNNDNVSLLYNLSYMDALAESFNYKKVARTCKIQKGKYINRIVEIIESASN